MNVTKVVTGEVRASYVNVFRPKLNELNGKDEFSMVVLIPKDDERTLQKLREVETAAIERKFGDKAPPKLRSMLRDGDTDDTYGGREGYEGHYFARVKSDRQPGVVDRNMNPIIDEKDFRSGDYCRVSLNAYAYDAKGNRGVSLGLENVQKLRSGDPLGGASRPEDDFEALDDNEFETESDDLDFG